MKPFSQACENNKQPILEILQRVFAGRRRVLEIGSGTGQHAVFFAAHLPQLHWQTSDLPENHSGIREWVRDAQLPNLAEPIVIDADQQPWSVESVDAVFTANTFHIMSWLQVERCFQGIAQVLQADAKLAVYGPFNYGGEFTSESNRNFDIWLKQRGSHQGIRDFEAVNALAETIGLRLLEDNAMPANNRLLVWGR